VRTRLSERDRSLPCGDSVQSLGRRWRWVSVISASCARAFRSSGTPGSNRRARLWPLRQIHRNRDQWRPYAQNGITNVGSLNVPRSTVNGPGECAVVWLQGCDLCYEGCWNPSSHIFDMSRDRPSCYRSTRWSLRSGSTLFGSWLARYDQKPMLGEDRRTDSLRSTDHQGERHYRTVLDAGLKPEARTRGKNESAGFDSGTDIGVIPDQQISIEVRVIDEW